MIKVDYLELKNLLMKHLENSGEDFWDGWKKERVLEELGYFFSRYEKEMASTEDCPACERKKYQEDNPGEPTMDIYIPHTCSKKGGC